MTESKAARPARARGGPDNSVGGPLLSVVIPAKDEARSIGTLISRSRSVLSKHLNTIIVVDDGSQDTTSDIAHSNGTVVLRHETNRGKGSAMKTGAARAGGDIIVFLDGDGAHDPQDVPAVIAPIVEGRADLVIGSRALPGSSATVSPLRRRLTNNLASFIITVIISYILPLVTGFKCPARYIRITDCTSGFRAITREGWRKLGLSSEGFEIETEMIYEAVRNGLVICEVPINCHWDSRLSHLSIARDGAKTVGLLIRKLAGDIGGRRVNKAVFDRPGVQTQRG